MTNPLTEDSQQLPRAVTHLYRYLLRLFAFLHCFILLPVLTVPSFSLPPGSRPLGCFAARITSFKVLMSSWLRDVMLMLFHVHDTNVQKCCPFRHSLSTNSFFVVPCSTFFGRFRIQPLLFGPIFDSPKVQFASFNFWLFVDPALQAIVLHTCVR